MLSFAHSLSLAPLFPPLQTPSRTSLPRARQAEEAQPEGTQPSLLPKQLKPRHTQLHSSAPITSRPHVRVGALPISANGPRVSAHPPKDRSRQGGRLE